MTYWTYYITTGWVAGILMLALYFYAARKHLKVFRTWGPMRPWFRVHVALGIITPIMVLIHTKIHPTSINGMAAFYSMLTVVASGLIGKFLLRRLDHEGPWRKWFSWWHIGHIPFLWIMGVAVVIHIIAAHAY
jgi:hypothetical protein